MIDFYLGEKPIFERSDLLCREPEQSQYTLAHLEELVVKEVHGAGGYGMLVGPAATREERGIQGRLRANPDNYIAQPTLALSTPDVRGSGIAPRHRPAPVRAVGQGRHHRSRRADSGRAA